MAAMSRFNNASLGVLLNKYQANAILFDGKVAFLRLIAGMTKKHEVQSLRLRVLSDSLPAIKLLDPC